MVLDRREERREVVLPQNAAGDPAIQAGSPTLCHIGLVGVNT